MLKNYSELKNEYSDYGNVKTKISRLVSSGQLIPVSRALYETDPGVDPRLLAGAIYGPSYISFQTALSEYGLIPDVVRVITSATTQKKHVREYSNTFGRYLFRDVPKAVFSFGLIDRSKGGYSCIYASPEKAVCDILYISNPVSNIGEFEELLFEDLRFDEYVFRELDMQELLALADLYRNTNHKFLKKLVKGIEKWSY